MTRLAFVVSLVLVLPLADLVGRRSLLTFLLALDAAALVAAGLSPGLPWALAAFAVLGLANVAAQVLVPVAAQLAPRPRRFAPLGPNSAQGCVRSPGSGRRR